jgi:hypothetical protein
MLPKEARAFDAPRGHLRVTYGVPRNHGTVTLDACLPVGVGRGIFTSLELIAVYHAVRLKECIRMHCTRRFRHISFLVSSSMNTPPSCYTRNSTCLESVPDLSYKIPN